MAIETERYGHVKGTAEQLIGFFVTDYYHILPLLSAMEPLRIANRLSGKALYRSCIVTSDGQPVTATNGVQLPSDHSVLDNVEYQKIFVSGPFQPKGFSDPLTTNWLKHLADCGTFLGGIETGCYLLAEAGLLEGYHCTTHWQSLADFVDSFPSHMVSQDVFEHDRDRITCAGGVAALDMMLYVIEQDYGHDLSVAVADTMVYPNVRRSTAPQRMGLSARIGQDHPVLLECIELMEANLEEPLSSAELAQLSKVSKRQLERIFRRHLFTTPARYYLELRLSKSYELLTTTSMKIGDIAQTCGFGSSGHFGVRFYAQFSMTPKESRQ